MKKIKLLTVLLLASTPLVGSAQLIHDGDTFSDITEYGLTIVSLLMKSVFALVSFGIIFTAFKYINALRGGDSKSANEYKKILIGAIIGMAVVFTLWGLISIIANTLGWTGVGIPSFTAPTE